MNNQVLNHFANGILMVDELLAHNPRTIMEVTLQADLADRNQARNYHALYSRPLLPSLPIQFRSLVTSSADDATLWIQTALNDHHLENLVVGLAIQAVPSACFYDPVSKTEPELAVLSICVGKKVLVFHLMESTPNAVPEALRSLLERDGVTVVGLFDYARDIGTLLGWVNIVPRRLVDLRHLAAVLWRCSRPLPRNLFVSLLTGIPDLYRELRLENSEWNAPVMENDGWNAPMLSHEQIMYVTVDAAICSIIGDQLEAQDFMADEWFIYPELEG